MDALQVLVSAVGGGAVGYILKRVEYAREDKARFITDKRDAYRAFVGPIGDFLARAGNVDSLLRLSAAPQPDSTQQQSDHLRKRAQEALDVMMSAEPHSQTLHLLSGSKARRALQSLERALGEVTVRLVQTSMTGKPAHVITPGSLEEHVATAVTQLDALLELARADLGVKG